MTDELSPTDDLDDTVEGAVVQLKGRAPLKVSSGGEAEVRFRRSKTEATGFDLIAETVKRLPNAPGVYRMLDAEGDVLYVGKARSLKKRVVSYSRPTGLSARLMGMVNRTVAMEFVTTATETEALLLEANLIKRFRPRFNVLLRDDKSFPYILLTGDHEAPQILKHRGAHSRKGNYFGPFASAGAVDRTINALQKAFLIRSCSDAVYESRTRPCLLYQIKRCSAPCTGEISADDYAGLVKQAKRFLSGNSKEIRKQLGAEMEEAAGTMEYERAARIRDRLASLSHVDSHQGINAAGIEEADVFAVHQDGGETCVQVFFFRTGQNWGNRAFFPKDEGLEAGALLETFLAQFYDDKPVPRCLFLSHEVPEAELLTLAFSERAGRKVEVTAPKRGTKKELVDHALANAREALGRRLSERGSQNKLLAGVAEAFGLPAPPGRIEVYDNSHIMGSQAVGGMIVAGPEGFSKAHYRKFNIKSADLTPGDDFGMMREVLTRRFTRLLKESPREGAATTAAVGNGHGGRAGRAAALRHDGADAIQSTPVDDDGPAAQAHGRCLGAAAQTRGAQKGVAAPAGNSTRAAGTDPAGAGRRSEAAAGFSDASSGDRAGGGDAAPAPARADEGVVESDNASGDARDGRPAAFKTVGDGRGSAGKPAAEPVTAREGRGGSAETDGESDGGSGRMPGGTGAGEGTRRADASATADADGSGRGGSAETDRESDGGGGSGADAAEDDPGTLSPWPDLVLIDGGAGQLSAAAEVLADLGVTDVPLVGVAKGVDRDAGREEFHIPGRKPFRLPPRDPVLYYVQRLRDEAHRFAIGAHRQKRKKALTANPLDEIAGVGAARKRALLKHFGTAKAVSKAGLDDLVAVDGISASVAKRVYDHFHAEAK